MFCSIISQKLQSLYQASFDHVKVGLSPVLALHNFWRQIHMFLDILEFRVEKQAWTEFTVYASVLKLSMSILMSMSMLVSIQMLVYLSIHMLMYLSIQMLMSLSMSMLMSMSMQMSMSISMLIYFSIQMFIYLLMSMSMSKS